MGYCKTRICEKSKHLERTCLHLLPQEFPEDDSPPMKFPTVRCRLLSVCTVKIPQAYATDISKLSWISPLSTSDLDLWQEDSPS